MKSQKIWILTLFPEYFTPLMNCGVVGKLLRKVEAQLKVKVINIRDYALNSYKSVDDYPFGGGPGMVMRADVLKNALYQGVIIPGGYSEEFEKLKTKLTVIFTSPRGRKWNAEECRRFAKKFNISKDDQGTKDLVFLCGRYEGVDQRFIDNYIDEEISVGDFVLSGGELPTLTILDSALRFVEGTLGNKEGVNQESFENGLLEAPQYTRPREFEGSEPPSVLLSGHHKAIEDYQKLESEKITKKHRPDLFDAYQNQKKVNKE